MTRAFGSGGRFGRSLLRVAAVATIVASCSGGAETTQGSGTPITENSVEDDTQGTTDAESSTTSSADAAPEPEVDDVDTCENFVFEFFVGAYAIVEARPVSDVTSPSAAFETTSFDVEEVLWVDESSPSPVEIGEQELATLVGLRPPQIDMMLESSADTSVTAVLVPTEVLPEVPWRIAAVITRDGIESGDECSPVYTARFTSLAQALGSDLVGAVSQMALFLRNQDDPTYRPVSDFLAGAGGGAASERTPEEEWMAMPVDSRDLADGLVLESFESRLDVFAVSIVMDGTRAVGDLTFRCDLGVGYAVVSNFPAIVRPLVTCIDATTEVTFDGELVGTIDPSQFDKDNGIEVAIRDLRTSPSITVRTLARGELEDLTGMTRQQLLDMEAAIKAGGAAESP